jgi:hypothetical protein
MTDQHSITPPPELVQQWRAAASNVPASLSTDPGGRRDYIDFIATKAAQWGADQELEACCEWLCTLESNAAVNTDRRLRIARRPKPSSLKEQALEELHRVDMLWDTNEFGPSTLSSLDTIRRALEQLDD